MFCFVAHVDGKTPWEEKIRLPVELHKRAAGQKLGTVVKLEIF